MMSQIISENQSKISKSQNFHLLPLPYVGHDTCPPRTSRIYGNSGTRVPMRIVGPVSYFQRTPASVAIVGILYYAY